jgi:hypothetical protein
MPKVDPFKVFVTVENETKEKAVKIEVKWDGEKYAVSQKFEPALPEKAGGHEDIYLFYASNIVNKLMED